MPCAPASLPATSWWCDDHVTTVRGTALETWLRIEPVTAGARHTCDVSATFAATHRSSTSCEATTTRTAHRSPPGNDAVPSASCTHTRSWEQWSRVLPTSTVSAHGAGQSVRHIHCRRLLLCRMRDARSHSHLRRRILGAEARPSKQQRTRWSRWVRCSQVGGRRCPQQSSASPSPT